MSNSNSSGGPVPPQPQPQPQQPPTAAYQMPAGASSAQVPPILSKYSDAIKSGAITASLMWVTALVVGLLGLLLLMALSGGPGPFNASFIALLFIAAGMSFGGGVHMSGGGPLFGDQAAHASIVVLTGTIIVSIVGYFILKKLRKNRPFGSLGALVAGIVSLWLTLCLMHLVLSAIGSLFRTGGSLAITMRSGFGFPVVAIFLIALVLCVVYEINRITVADTPLKLWGIRAREAFPFLTYTMLGTGLITLVVLVLGGLSTGELRSTGVGGGFATAIFALGHLFFAGPGLAIGSPMTFSSPGAGFGSYSAGLFSFLPAWASLISIVAALALLFGLAVYLSRKLPPAPMIRTGVFAVVFAIAGIIAMILTGISGELGILEELNALGVNGFGSGRMGMSFILVFVYALWGAVIDLVARFVVPGALPALKQAKQKVQQVNQPIAPPAAPAAPSEAPPAWNAPQSTAVPPAVPPSAAPDQPQQSPTHDWGQAPSIQETPTTQLPTPAPETPWERPAPASEASQQGRGHDWGTGIPSDPAPRAEDVDKTRQFETVAEEPAPFPVVESEDSDHDSAGLGYPETEQRNIDGPPAPPPPPA